MDATPLAAPEQRYVPRTLSTVLSELDGVLTAGGLMSSEAVPVGFPLVDRVLAGGVRAGDLVLVGGGPGVGKTVVTLQWARNVAASGRTAIYACYEHEAEDLVVRLLLLELGDVSAPFDVNAEWIRQALHDAATDRVPVETALRDRPEAVAAYGRLRAYGDHLVLVPASGAHTGLPELAELVVSSGDRTPVLFVDYLQKIAVHPEPPDEAEKVTRIVEGLKDIALDMRIPVVSVVAADREGLRARRIRLHHLRGSSALAFECDVALILNEKFNAVSNVHLQYDPLRAETFRDWVVFSIEKNRGGPTLLDIEFRKDFGHYRFDPEGGVVSEKLVDERVYSE